MTPPLNLDQVSLITIDTRQPSLAILAMRKTMAQINFGEAIAFVPHGYHEAPQNIRLIETNEVNSAEDYSKFVIRSLRHHISKDFVLIVQWDGFAHNPLSWRSEFLLYDYIGATWPQYDDNARVGNGGFSIRSTKLMDAVAQLNPTSTHPEDEVICRNLRRKLETEHDIKFAPEHVADQFSAERQGDPCTSFGFHGLSNLPFAIPAPEIESLLSELPADIFGSTEGRRLIKVLLSQRLDSTAKRALSQRVAQTGWSAETARLWARVMLRIRSY
jgi:hypothetical protein